ncbi:MAG: sulfotransferase [Leptolyngbyaceae bacterium]|nr:sulfotransferase [Leptolyngbyaceae bacterium]
MNFISHNNGLPNLVIIGAMKCGTTSLHHYLNRHPEIHMSATKELDFFIEEKNWKRGVNWYQSQFKSFTKIIGESSPNYTKYPIFKNVPKRMHRIIPDAKLIYLVRDPVKRALSHYMHQYTARCDSRTVDEAFSTLENNHYIQCSLYGKQLEYFLNYYSLSNILIMSLEELSQKRSESLTRIFRFLDVDPNFDHPDFSSIFHQSQQKERLTAFGACLYKLPMGGRFASLFSSLVSEAVRQPKINRRRYQQILDFLKEDIQHFKKLTNYDVF